MFLYQTKQLCTDSSTINSSVLSLYYSVAGTICNSFFFFALTVQAGGKSLLSHDFDLIDYTN
jgi:hypothetical protein